MEVPPAIGYIFFLFLFLYHKKEGEPQAEPA